MQFFLILLHIFRCEITGRCRCKCRTQRLIFDIHQHLILCNAECCVILICLIRSHGYTEAMFKTFPAFQHDYLYFLTQSRIEIVCMTSIFHENTVQSCHSVDITRTSNHNDPFVICKLALRHFRIGKIKHRL